jgi:phage terminase small subunit
MIKTDTKPKVEGMTSRIVQEVSKKYENRSNIVVKEKQFVVNRSKSVVRPLNQRQMNFVMEYINNGGNATSAYRVAYNCDKPFARISGTKLLSNANIQQYLAEMQTKIALKIQQEVIITKETQLKELQDWKVIAVEDRDINGFTRIVEIQNKMLGLNEAEKLDLGIEQRLKSGDIKTLDNQFKTLKRLKEHSVEGEIVE